jgi:hypothetical protein
MKCKLGLYNHGGWAANTTVTQNITHAVAVKVSQR